MEMASTRSHARVFLGVTLVTIFVAALVTLVSGATMPQLQTSSEALNYIRSRRVQKVIFDVDCGADDAIGILLALTQNRPDAPEVIAITTTHGNVDVDTVSINVLKTLRAVGKKVPVYMGSATSLISTPTGDGFFGDDGFGDVPDPSPPSLDQVEKEHAAVALARLARENPGELTVISLGPLTNLALAQRLDSNFKENLRVVYWMGGSVEGIGNIKPGIEFNAFMDPEANFIVFNATGPPIITLSWETCFYHGAMSKEWRVGVLGKMKSPLIEFINNIERKSIPKASVWTPCDAQTAAVLLDPSIATKAAHHNVEPIFQGDARGALMVDYRDKLTDDKNMIIVQQIDTEKFQDMLIRNLAKPTHDKSV